MKAVVDQVYKTGDTVGGVFEVVAHGVPPGLGFAHRLGHAAGREAGAGHRFDAGGEGRGDRLRGRRRGGVRIEGAGHDPLRSRGAPVSRAAPIAPADWKAA